MTTKILTIITICVLFSNQVFSQDNISNKVFGERINGPANIRDTINGKILFSLDDNVKVECTEAKNNWHIVGLDALINPTQFKQFKYLKGDTIFNTHGEKIGVIISDIQPLMINDYQVIETGFIEGYTYKGNIKPESIIENVLVEIIKTKEFNVALNELNEFINSFGLKKCSPTSMADENGEWYFYEDNLIDDISPRDRITLIIENKKLLGIVHSHNIILDNCETYSLIRGHKFTTIGSLPKNKIDEIIKDRIKWYNSVD